MSCPHSNRVGTTIAVLPGCSHYYLQVIMTSNLSSGVGLGGERKSRTYKNQTHLGIPLPEIFAQKKNAPGTFSWINPSHVLPEEKLDRKAAPTSAGKRHFLMKSRIDKKIISTPCSFSPHWTISVPSRRNQTITCDADETKPFSPKPRRFGVGNWHSELSNYVIGKNPYPQLLLLQYHWTRRFPPFQHWCLDDRQDPIEGDPNSCYNPKQHEAQAIEDLRGTTLSAGMRLLGIYFFGNCLLVGW